MARTTSDATTDPTATSGLTSRQRLLDAAIEHISVDGVGELTLRQLAAAIGTSHRMLLYHFGSREALLIEIMRGLEARQRDVVAAIVTKPGSTPQQMARRIWKALSAPELQPQVRAYFEIYGQALSAGETAAEPLAQLLTDWLAPLEALERARGAPPARARATVRLGAAVLRGLLLDLAATGDRRGVDAAHERWVSGFDPNP